MPVPPETARYFGVHAAALELRGRRVALLASNIANAATPNFKARDIDFAAALARAEGVGPLSSTSPLHFSAAPVWGASESGYRLPVSPSLDGNTVELSTEQVLFGENAARYQATLAFISGRAGDLIAALRGE